MKIIINSIYALTILFIVSVLFIYKDVGYQHFMAKYNYLALAVGIIILITIYLVVKQIVKKVSDNNILRLVYTISTLLLILQLPLIYSYYYSAGHDLEMVINNSFSLANSGELKDIWYFSTYPNNIFIVFLYSNIIKFGYLLGINNIHFVIIIMLCMLSWIASILTYKVLDMLFKNNIYSLMGYFYYILLIGISPWLAIIYTDTLGVIFPITMLYLYLLIKNKKYVAVNTILLVTIAAISVSIKPQSFIIFIAILIYELFIRENNVKTRVKNILIFVVGIVVVLQIISLSTINIKSQLNPEKNIGYMHYIKMGLNKEGLGVYDSNDFKTSVAVESKKDRDKYNIEVIKERINNYTISTYLEHLIQKTVLNYNNGTFGWYWVASYVDYNYNYNETFLSKFGKIVYYKDGKFYKPFNLLQQSNWIMIMILSVISIFNFKDNRKILLSLTIIGLFLFVSIFEASARYIFTNVPIFIVIAMYGLMDIIELNKKIINKFILK